VGDALVASLEASGVDASGVRRLSAEKEKDEESGGTGRRKRRDGGAEEAETTASSSSTSTPVVVAVHDPATGDVACSVADVAAVEESFTPEIVRREMERIGSGGAAEEKVFVIVDGNLSAAAVAAAACSSSSHSRSSSNPGIALFEPVSVAKGVRAVRGGQLKCKVMTPNAAELLAMARAVEEEGSNFSTSTSTSSSNSGFSDAGEKSRNLDHFLRSTLAPAARALISRGVCEFVLVTLGERGAALIGREEEMRGGSERDAAGLFKATTTTTTNRDNGSSSSSSSSSTSNLFKLAACVVPAAPIPSGGVIVSTGGAGDAFAAGFLAAVAAGSGENEKTRTMTEPKSSASIPFALAAGAAAAAQVVASPLSSPKLDAESVWRCARDLEARARWVAL